MVSPPAVGQCSPEVYCGISITDINMAVDGQSQRIFTACSSSARNPSPRKKHVRRIVLPKQTLSAYFMTSLWFQAAAASFYRILIGMAQLSFHLHRKWTLEEFGLSKPSLTTVCAFQSKPFYGSVILTLHYSESISKRKKSRSGEGNARIGWSGYISDGENHNVLSFN